jgi:site-specific DNA recombinase
VTRRAAIYVRISADPSGQRLGVTRQLDACRAKAEAMGWTVAVVHEDNDVSASGTKPRPAYQRLLADLAEGRADAVVVWDLDRLTRRPIEIEAFIDLADRHRIALASVGGDVDLATDNGRMFARIKGAVARAEIERKSARQRAANTQRAEAGRPPAGRRAFGYSQDGMVVVESEAAEVRKAVDTVLAGGSIRSIVADLAARGVPTTMGGPWRPTELRRLLANPRYAGQRVHRGEVIGPGTWPAIVDLDSWRAVQGVLADPSRHKAGRPERYLLSGVARCAVCGGRIYGAREPRGRTYLCESRRHVVRRAENVEHFVVKTVLARLARPDARELFSRADSRDQAQGLREEEASLRARLDGLSEAFAEGDIDREQLRKGSQRLRLRLTTVTSTLASLAVTPAVADLVSSADVAQAWNELDLDRQRAVVDTLLGVVLHSPGRGARHFNPTTVELTWK